MKSMMDETQTQWQLKNPYLPITCLLKDQMKQCLAYEKSTMPLDTFIMGLGQLFLKSAILL